MARLEKYIEVVRFEQQERTKDLVQRDKICALEVWCEALGGDIKLMRRSDTREINEVLNGINGLKKSDSAIRFIPDYGVQKGFVVL